MPVISYDCEMEGEENQDEEGSLVADLDASGNPKGPNSESGGAGRSSAAGHTDK